MFPKQRRRAATSDESGFTIVELTVTSAIGAMATMMIAGMMMSSVNAESQVRDLTHVNAEAQVAYNSLDKAARNSASMAVSSVGSDLLLRAATVSSGTTPVWGCSAWYYSATDKTLRHKSSTSAIGAPTSTLRQRSWMLLSSDVVATSGTPVFALTSNGAGGQTLTATFSIQIDGQPSTSVTTVASNRAVTVPEGAPRCF